MFVQSAWNVGLYLNWGDIACKHGPHAIIQVVQESVVSVLAQAVEKLCRQLGANLEGFMRKF